MKSPAAAVAVVGTACEYPEASSPARLWENVLAQRQAFRRIPPERLRLEDYLGDRSVPDSLYAARAAVIEGWELDRVRFRVAGPTHRVADPAHWLALDVADRALEDAGFPGGEGLPRGSTGVVLGNTLTGEVSRAQSLRLRWPYVRRTVDAELRRAGWEAPRRRAFLEGLEVRYKEPFPEPNEESLAGGLANTIAGRIANHFDLGGGGYTVDGACSSSLLAVAQGATALLLGDVDVALVGGVDLSLDPFELVGFSRTGALAAGPMRVFDARPTGFIPGEGCGVVVLMRLDEALEQGRPVRAVVRGWGISSDGSGGITRPEVAGQRRALEQAYRRAGYGIETVGYFEGHGTGTAVGDETELAALTESRRAAEPGAPPAPVGSVKANIGHTKAAAGVAALLKAVSALEQQILPPNTGCSEPHPLLRGSDAALCALGSGRLWPADRPLRAGVSSMGFGGINVHLTLEGTAEALGDRPRRRSLSALERAWLASAQDAEVLVLSASDREGLAALVERLAELAPRLARSELADLGGELARRYGGGGGPWSASLVAAEPEELTEGLQVLGAWLDEDDPGSDSKPGLRLDARRGVALGAPRRTAAPRSRPRVGFLFPGQASPPHLEGGAWARRFPELRELWQGLDEGLSRETSGEREGPLDTAHAQPLLVTACRAGLAVLDRLGIEASVALGHSLGELPALAWAGALDEEDLTRLAAVRGRAMSELGDADGAMASLAASAGEVEPWLSEEVRVAACNSPRQTVVSGPREAVEAVLERARREGVGGVRLPVSHAFHSPLVAAAAEPLDRHLEGLELRSPVRPVVSTVSGEELRAAGTDGAGVREILVRQITEPVLFRQAVEVAQGGAAKGDVEGAGTGVDLWIEVGAGRVLSGLMADLSPTPVVPLDAGGPSLRGLLSAVGAAHCLGLPVAVEALYEGRVVRPLPLDRRFHFLANPCEQAPLPEDEGRDAEPLLRGTQLRGTGDGEVEQPAFPGGVGDPSPTRLRASDEARELAAAGAEPLEVVRRLVAARAELPAAAVEDHHRLLSDLHLNSISAGQVVAEAARALGKRPPSSSTEYANAQVEEVARVLAEAPGGGPEPEAGADEGREADEPFPAGIDAWVRPFGVEWVEETPPREPAPGEPDPEGFRVVAPPEHPLVGEPESCDTLERKLAGSGRRGVALLLPPLDHLSPASLPQEATTSASLCLQAAREILRFDVARSGGAAPAVGESEGSGPCLLVLQQGGGGGGFARTLHLEHRELDVAVVDLPFDHPEAPAWAAAEAAAARGYRESRYDADGGRVRPYLAPLESSIHEGVGGGGGGLPGALSLGPEDVLLVTGGGKGIGAECALALARAYGVRLGLVGRSRPKESGELNANLERMAEAGIRVHYSMADVTDREEVRRAVAEAEAHLGPVTAILHAAGTNEPRLVSQLEPVDLFRTLQPKVGGLQHLLDAVEPERLKLLVTFGSIIARLGLPGEADYALANEWLARATEGFAAENPACRCLCLEWSVWSGVGMGERLGRLEALAREGIGAIPPEVGVDWLERLLSARNPPVSVVVAGRFGAPPTLTLPPRELPLQRFLERPRVHYPGVELVVEAEISEGTDPYLADHVFRGERLFPAVMGLEAMAQAARAVTGEESLPVFEGVELARPVVVPAEGSEILRLAALVRRGSPPGERVVEVAVRCGATGFAVDHFRARCVFRAAGARVPEGEGGRAGRRIEAREAPAWSEPASGGGAEMLLRGAELYGGLLFQGGRFQRLEGYRRLLARECIADISADGATVWFARHLPSELVLGDPGVRDATLHGIQASIPHATVLPMAVDRLVVDRLSVRTPFRLAARERRREGDVFVYDVEVLDAEERVVERWEGLRLKAVERLGSPPVWRVPLLGPYVERRMQELLPGSPASVLLIREPGGRERNAETDPGSRQEASDRVLTRLLGIPARVHRRPDGKPEVEGWRVSLAHAGDLVLAVAGEGDLSGEKGPLGCDLEPVAERSEVVWRDLLGAERWALAHELAARVGGDRQEAATRVWAAVECLKKAGAMDGAPLLLEQGTDGGEAAAEGWQLLRAGDLVIGTLVVPVEDADAPLALAVLTRARR